MITGIVTAVIALAMSAGAMAVSKRSAAGAMGAKGPGIRLPETMGSQERWVAAQKAAAPLYQKVAVSTAVSGVLALVLGLAGAPPALVAIIPIVLILASMVFFFGVATVRAKKAAEAAARSRR